MARKRISMKKIREILKLKTDTELSNRQIAKVLRISRPLVTKYLKELKKAGISYEESMQMPDMELEKIFKQDKSKINTKYTVLAKKFPKYLLELKRKGVTLELLWQEYKRENPEGYMYSRFCYHFQTWKKATNTTMHIEHKAGDKMFVDYAGDKLCILNPKTKEKTKVETFVAILGASELFYVEVSPNQSGKEWVCSNERAIRYFHGVPRAIIPDNLKSAVTRTDPYEPGINPLFDDFADYYGTVIMPARVRKPRDKALVENAVRLVYQRIYAPLRNKEFYTIESLNEAIWELLEVHNNKNLSRLDYSRRELYEKIEKKALLPLPQEKYQLKEIYIATVQFNYHVELREDRHYYSVPYYLRKQTEKTQVKIEYDEELVSIYYDNVRIVQYKRDRQPNGYTTKPEHMPKEHRFYAQWSTERIQNWAKKYGSNTLEIVNKILKNKKYPEQAFKTCLGLLNLAKRYGEVRFIKACKKANQFNIYSLKRIETIIKLIQEEETHPQLELDYKLPKHENIRGSNYYN